MKNRIDVVEKVYGPGVTPDSLTLLAAPGDSITTDQAEAWGIGADGRATGDGVSEATAALAALAGLSPEQLAELDLLNAPPADSFPTLAEIRELNDKQLKALNKQYELGVPSKMKVDDRRVAVAGAIEELALTLAGLDGLSTDDIEALDAASAGDD